ncbi:MAG: HepT-like ribonuclease domain-containing protein [Chitinophagaceae bacterium]
MGNIKDFTRGITFDMYVGDLKTKHAVERNFSIIGEAVARIDKSFWDKHSSVDWLEVKDFRNIIVHDYFGIDDTIVWDIIYLNLDQLEKDIVVILASVS